MNLEYRKQVEAYVDGEMSAAQAQRMKETIKSFPELEDYAHKLEKQKDMLRQWWDNSRNKHH